MVEGDIALVDDDEIRLALAVMTERARTTIVGVETGRIANVEVEQRRVTGVRTIVAERIGRSRVAASIVASCGS